MNRNPFKSAVLALVLALFALVQGALAQTDVNSESALLSAINGGKVVSVRLTANITLTQCLLIDGERVVTIDLNGHELGRGLNGPPATGDGHVIGVRTGSRLTIDDGSGNNAGRISGGWAANGGGIYNNGVVIINGGTITGNHATQKGGGIYNIGDLAIYGGVISSSMAEVAGGGIYNGGDLYFNGGVVLGNYGEDCGGIYNATMFYMTGGTITGNTSHAGGGGVVNYGTASITGGNIHNNHATTRGGGIWNGGTLTLEAANIVSNRANIEGGGVYYNSTTPTSPVPSISGVTIKDNRAGTSGTDAINGVGGGIYIPKNLRVKINNSTISGNRAVSGKGGGIYNQGTIELNGTTVMNDTCAYGGGFYNTADGTLYLYSGSTIGNSYASYGGGIYNSGLAYVMGTVSGNHGTHAGGGIWSNGSISVVDATIEGNSADYQIGVGGGIFFSGVEESYRVENSVIRNNSASDGGGIYVGIEGTGNNQVMAKVSVRNSSVIGNKALTKNGGGISVEGMLFLQDVEITGNSSKGFGGGVWNGGSLNLSSGVITINGNTDGHNMASNVYVANSDYSPRYIYCSTLDASSKIGVSIHRYDRFTSNYKAQGYFFPDLATNDLKIENDDEASLKHNPRKYYESSWDAENKKVVHTLKEIPADGFVNANMTPDIRYSLGESWIIADGEHTFSERFAVFGDSGAVVHLVLLDGARVTFQKGLLICTHIHLHIHSQSYGRVMGSIESTAEDQAGIGGREEYHAGSLTIHGGRIQATGAEDCAGIGGGEDDKGFYGDIVIYDGEINAQGGDNGAGIGMGNGNRRDSCGTINIYGGIITATGGVDAAGIGGGEDSPAGVINIYGGDVTARGGKNGAGIGAGGFVSIEAPHTESRANGEITIEGGTVYATGGKYGAGIGGGYYYSGGKITIRGGNVRAQGGVDGAGIGSGSNYEDPIGGCQRDGGIITISGGHVYALGKGVATGIGSGDGFGMGKIAITGGVVEAVGGGEWDYDFVDSRTWSYAIGGSCTEGASGYADDPPYYKYGFTLGDNMMVSVGESSNSIDSIAGKDHQFDAVKSRLYARIEPCTHNWSYTDMHDGHHDASCSYCRSKQTYVLHQYGDGHTCVCGASDVVYTVTLARATEGSLDGAYTPQNITLLKGMTRMTLSSTIPAAPSGYEFVGWYEGDLDDIVPGGYYLKPSVVNPKFHEPGEAHININANTTFIAVYRLVNSGAVSIDYASSTATINGNYAGTDVVNIPGDITVNNVVFDRAFENGVASTVVLPFSITTDKVAGANFYDITEVKKDANGQWNSVGTHRLGKTEVETIVANKPYLVKLKDGESALTFQGPVTLNTSVRQPYTVNDDLWSFRGAYGTFAIGDSASLVGITYGFTSTAQDGYDKGVFAKGASDARIPAMRCYLVYMGNNRQLARSALMARNYTSAIPGTIDVEFDDGEEGTTVIGKLDMATGEIHLAPRTADRWFDIQGNMLNGKPTIKGRYIHNGKLEIIK